MIELNQSESLLIMNRWNVWKRNGGVVFDYNNEYRLLLVCENEGKCFYREIFPKLDTSFHSINEVPKKHNHYPFIINELEQKIDLFNKLNVNQIKSLIDYDAIMLVKDDYTIIFLEKGANAKFMTDYKQYSKYNENWYYFLK